MKSYFKYYSDASLKMTLSDGTRKWSSPSVFNDPFDNMIDIQWAWNPLEFEKKMNENICKLAQETKPDLSAWPADMQLLLAEIKKAPKAKRAKLFKELRNPVGLYSDQTYKEKFSRVFT